MELRLWGLLAGSASLALLLANVALTLYARSRTRSSLLHDVILRTSAGFVLVQAILLYTNANAMAPAAAIEMLGLELVMLAISVWLVIPAAFLARTARSTDGYVVLSRGIIEGLHARLDQSFGPGPAHLIAYSVGKEAGYQDVRKAVDVTGLHGAWAWRLLPYVFRTTGYGRLRFAGLAPGKEVRLRLRHSMESFPHKHEGDAVGGCDLTRGYLAGMGKALHPELECQAEEMRCAHGDPQKECEFVIRWFEPMKAIPGA